MTNPETPTRRDLLLGAGALAVVSGTVGCLGLGDDDDESAENPENETNSNGLEDSSAELDTEENETDDNERLGDFQGNATEGNQDDIEPNDPEDDDRSVLEGESNDHESNEEDENDFATEQDEFGDDSNDGGNNTESSTNENDSETEQDDADGDDSDDDGEFEQIIIEELSYQVDYPANWEVVETNEGIPLTIVNSDETAWVWIDIRETHLNLDEDIRNYRQNFEPHPDIEIHEDEPMTLSSGEDGHRFVIEVNENPENPLYAHELLANDHGNEYLTSVQVSRPEYDEDYTRLAEDILASVELR